MKDLLNDAASLNEKHLNDGVARRDFLKVALGTGFAAAALPVVAQNVIKTDTDDLTAGTVTVTVNGTAVPVYRAQPAGKTGLPVILVISEIFGVHEHIADVARRFAKLGYLALAPDLFVRQGDATKAPSQAELMKNIYAEYKAKRNKTPGEFSSQLPLIEEVLDALRIPFLKKDGFEADDIIATLVTQALADDMDVLVLTGDRDALQLVTEHSTVLYPMRGVSDLARMTPEAVEAKYGVPPHRYPELAAI
eukprot:gene32254-36413_t